MPFPFALVCDLLQQISDLSPGRRNQDCIVNQLIHEWFVRHRSRFRTEKGLVHVYMGAALLSTLLPDHRTDRVYGLQAKSLQRVVARALGIGHSRMMELDRWTRPGLGGIAVDLGDCVEGILKKTPNPLHPDDPPVMVEELDGLLHGVAARCRFSSPAVRTPAGTPTANQQTVSMTSAKRDEVLSRLYQRLDSRDAKWLTRLVLKDYRPVVLDPIVVARALHTNLPLALRVHSDFTTAIESLAEARPTGQPSMVPRVGVKVGRQQWAKARSIKHCLAMGGRQRMSCERKMDGEYVQVHVDMAKEPHECLQLFSKSGKDSTQDRTNLHGVIRESLRIGQPDCAITKGCILEGEMLVYNEKEDRIMDFDAIRRHVTRSGSMLYADPNAEAQDHEHLMIVYFDLLFHDESLLDKRHSERFGRLERLVNSRAGYAEIVQRQIIDFGSRTAAEELRQAFAKCLTARLEGLVVKPENDPYFDFSSPSTSAPLVWPFLRSYAVKLKKGYIGEFGEVGDFAIVGARYDATKAKEYPPGLPGLRWTHFFLGCVDKTSKRRRPRFVVTNIVTLTVPQMTMFLRHCRPRVVPMPKKMLSRRREDEVLETGKEAEEGENENDETRAPFDLEKLEPGLDDSRGGPTELFADPPVAEVRCFSFHRQGYGRFWSPRFPSVVKFHFDRTYLESLTFQELQSIAEEEANRKADASVAGEDAEVVDYDAPEDPDDEAVADERNHWTTQLRRADSGGIAVDAETSQSSDAAETERSDNGEMSQSTEQMTSEAGSQNSSATVVRATVTSPIEIPWPSSPPSPPPSSLPSQPLSSPYLLLSQPPVPASSITSSPPLLSTSPRRLSTSQITVISIHSSMSSNRSLEDGGDSGDHDEPLDSKKRLCPFDRAIQFPAVSPPQLKRQKSQPGQPSRGASSAS